MERGESRECRVEKGERRRRVEKKRSPKRLFVGTVCTFTLSVCCRMGNDETTSKQFCTPPDHHIAKPCAPRPEHSARVPCD
eukprot:scaffold90682_cov72-Phaeocystis_antarctica.AAC.3